MTTSTSTETTGTGTTGSGTTRVRRGDGSPLLPGVERTGEQHQLAQALRSFFTAECPTARVRAAEPLGHDADLWQQAVELGLVRMALPAERGGDGGGLADAAVAAAEAGRALAPLPLLETVVGHRLLARAEQLGAAAVYPASPSTVVVVGFAPLVPGEPLLHAAGAVAEQVVAPVGEELTVLDVASRTPHPRNLACQPLGTVVPAAPGTRIADGALARRLRRRALAEFRVLQASALTGLAARALEMAVDYATARTAFGRPIGGFQALAHRLADLATLCDGAQLLNQEAAVVLDGEGRRGDELAAMAHRHAVRTAVATTEYALHVHGGAGFALEYDIQLFFRRAHGWPLALPRQLRGAESVARELFGKRRAQ